MSPGDGENNADQVQSDAEGHLVQVKVHLCAISIKSPPSIVVPLHPQESHSSVDGHNKHRFTHSHRGELAGAIVSKCTYNSSQCVYHVVMLSTVQSPKINSGTCQRSESDYGHSSQRITFSRPRPFYY